MHALRRCRPKLMVRYCGSAGAINDLKYWISFPTLEDLEKNVLAEPHSNFKNNTSIKKKWAGYIVQRSSACPVCTVPWELAIDWSIHGWECFCLWGQQDDSRKMTHTSHLSSTMTASVAWHPEYLFAGHRNMFVLQIIGSIDLKRHI